MLKAAIFDLNGIFMQSEKLSDRFARDFNVPATDFLPKLSVIMEEVRKPGARPAFEYWKPELEKWGINLSEKEFWEYWFGVEVLSKRMVAFAKSLKEKGIKVFILSNNFKERADYYGSYDWIHEAVDKTYFSWQTGFVKPDVRAWELVLQENNLTSEECVYFDDQQKNLDACNQLGIKAFMFTNEEDLERIIGRIL